MQLCHKRFQQWHTSVREQMLPYSAVSEITTFISYRRLRGWCWQSAAVRAVIHSKQILRDARINHGFKRQFNACFYHRDISTPLSKYSCSPILPSYCGGFRMRFCQSLHARSAVSYRRGPVSHHAGGEFAGDDVVHMFWNSGAMISFSCSESA